MRARCNWLCEEVRKKGPGTAVEVQNAMQRLALDMIMLNAFGMDPHAVDFKESVILDSLHYVFNDIFRCGLDLPGSPLECASAPLRARVSFLLGNHVCSYAMQDPMICFLSGLQPVLCSPRCCDIKGKASLKDAGEHLGPGAVLGNALTAHNLGEAGFAGPSAALVPRQVKL